MSPDAERLFGLYGEAFRLAGRDVTVEELADGQFIVEWFSFADPPPPKADTEEKALQGFINMMLNRAPRTATMPEEDTLPGAKDGTEPEASGTPVP